MNIIQLENLRDELLNLFDKDGAITLGRADRIESALNEQIEANGINSVIVEIFELVELVKNERPEKIDGVKVYEGDTVYFDDWLTENGYSTQEIIYIEKCENDIDQNDYETMIEDLQDKFFNWCDENELTGTTI